MWKLLKKGGNYVGEIVSGGNYARKGETNSFRWKLFWWKLFWWKLAISSETTTMAETSCCNKETRLLTSCAAYKSVLLYNIGLLSPHYALLLLFFFFFFSDLAEFRSCLIAVGAMSAVAFTRRFSLNDCSCSHGHLLRTKLQSIGSRVIPRSMPVSQYLLSFVRFRLQFESLLLMALFHDVKLFNGCSCSTISPLGRNNNQSSLFLSIVPCLPATDGNCHAHVS